MGPDYASNASDAAARVHGSSRDDEGNESGEHAAEARMARDQALAEHAERAEQQRLEGGEREVEPAREERRGNSTSTDGMDERVRGAIDSDLQPTKVDKVIGKAEKVCACARGLVCRT
jgi:hypothetical protein